MAGMADICMAGLVMCAGLTRTSGQFWLLITSYRHDVLKKKVNKPGILTKSSIFQMQNHGRKSETLLFRLGLKKNP